MRFVRKPYAVLYWVAGFPVVDPDHLAWAFALRRGCSLPVEGVPDCSTPNFSLDEVRSTAPGYPTWTGD